MTIRSVLVGFALAMFIVLTAYFNDIYMKQTLLVSNHFPISVMGTLVLIALFVNPLLTRLNPRWRLRRAELAVIVALPLAVCVLPGLGFLRTFSQTLLLPHHFEKSIPSWQRNEVLSYVPNRLLVDLETHDSETVLGSYLEGMGTQDEHIGLGDIPWAAWRTPLLIWIPLFLILMFGLIGLSLVLHRQWTVHEHLVYPVAHFVHLLTGGPDRPAGGQDKTENGRTQPESIIRNRLFWYGFTPILVLHVVNGLHAWFPNFIEIPRVMNITPLTELFPGMVGAGGWGLFKATIFFTVVAFAYFLPSDVTLSLGCCYFFRVLFILALTRAGITMRRFHMGDGDDSGLVFGAYVALAGFIIYNGRAYYRKTLAAAFRRGAPPADIEQDSVWGMRVFLAMMLVGFTAMVGIGLAWPFALLALVSVVMMFTVISRVCAETGLFFIQPGWHTSGALLGIFGASALGPTMLVVVTLFCVIIAMDPRAAMMPYVVNALRIGENADVRKGRLAWLMGGTLAIGAVAGLVVMLWLQYDRGFTAEHGWDRKNVPQAAFKLLDAQIQQMKSAGTLEQARKMGLARRFLAISPNKKFLGFALTGFVLLIGCSFLRLRFPRWPFHPVLFLVWTTWPLLKFWLSFLLGWLVKSLVVRFGGGNVYQRGKPVMIGVIAGELTGGLIFMVVGAVYYFVTGFAPTKYMIFP